jgi:hypothetical protein
MGKHFRQHPLLHCNILGLAAGFLQESPLKSGVFKIKVAPVATKEVLAISPIEAFDVHIVPCATHLASEQMMRPTFSWLALFGHQRHAAAGKAKR